MLALLDRHDSIVIQDQGKGSKMSIKLEIAKEALTELVIPTDIQNEIADKMILGFELKNLKELETPRGISWTADIVFRGEVVGDVYDNGCNIVPSYSFINKDMRQLFEKWSEKYGMEEFKDVDLIASGLYFLSEVYDSE
jgi:hypothetical protein